MGEITPNNKLVIISKYYPFNLGEVPAESYLESEIQVLASMFERVYVFAVDAPKDRPLCQKLPDGVVAYPLGVARDKLAKLGLLATSLFPIQSKSKGLYEAVRKTEQLIGSIGKLAMFRYAFVKAEAYRLAIVATAKEEGLNLWGGLFYSFWLFDTALAASKLATSFHGKAVSRAHRYDLYEDQNPLGYLPFRHYLGESLDVIAPCSRDGVKHLEEIEGYSSKKVQLSYLGTDDLGFKRLSLDDGSPLVISCSTLTKVKRVPLIAEAMEILDKEGFCLRWRHYGAGPETDDVKATVERFANIDVKLTGFIDHRSLLEEYRMEPPVLFVNASSSEGLPISIMEACSLGTPIVCTDVGGTAEIVSGENGVLLGPNPSSEELAKAIRHVLTLDGESYSRLRERSRQIWEERFDTRANVMELFSGIMKGYDNG